VAEPVIVLVPTGVDARAMGPATVTGSGADSVSGAVRALVPRLSPGTPVAVTGPAGRLGADLAPGQLVVADELWAAASGARPRLVRRLPSATLLAHELRRDGHRVAVGAVLSTSGPSEATVGDAGALVVDHDSAWAAAMAGDRPLAVVRTVVEAPGPGAMAASATLVPPGVLAPEGSTPHPGARPGTGSSADARRSASVREVIERWGRACRARTILLASPRSFCAGVERAIEIVERALERYGAPVYVRRQIVHNTHVVGRLAALGAVFVEELDEVPDGATVVLAAHGVSPDVRAQAGAREGFTVIDATCPLVAKVHHEARRYASRGYDIVLVGHSDHEEVVGTYGEAPERMHVVSTPEEVDDLALDPGTPVAYLTQTTLATDETAEVVDALRRRYPGIAGPSTDDICYATQNRQDAVRAIARDCDLLLVVGSANSSNTARLVEVARREGCRAELVEDAGQLRLSWLDGAGTVGVTAGASAPEPVVTELVEALAALGPVQVDERRTTTETVRFALPLQVR